jgi:hypothetical protein
VDVSEAQLSQAIDTAGCVPGCGFVMCTSDQAKRGNSEYQTCHLLLFKGEKRRDIWLISKSKQISVFPVNHSYISPFNSSCIEKHVLEVLWKIHVRILLWSQYFINMMTRNVILLASGNPYEIPLKGVSMKSGDRLSWTSAWEACCKHIQALYLILASCCIQSHLLRYIRL